MPTTTHYMLGRESRMDAIFTIGNGSAHVICEDWPNGFTDRNMSAENARIYWRMLDTKGWRPADYPRRTAHEIRKQRAEYVLKRGEMK